jgi:DNA-binding NarL/FixJ family response regulator
VDQTDKPHPTVKVLIADDSDVIRRTVSYMLKAAGLAVVGTAETDAEAIELTRSTQPDAVLLDLHLANSTGMSALEAIRKECPAVAVLLYSGDDDPAFVRRAKERGADAYVVKGGSLPSLISAIREAVERRRSQQGQA